jgi:glucose/arabinose dehydrogenase
MVGAQLGRVSLSGTTAMSEETLLGGVLGRIRDVREGPDGFVYLAIEAEQGGTPLSDVVRLEPTQTDVTPPR